MKENLVLWIDGQDGIRRIIQHEQWNIDKKITDIKDELASFNTKNVKGKKYWYQWISTMHGPPGGKWKYIGRKDPRPKMNVRIKQLETMKKTIKKKFMDKIHSELGKHLIVDPKKIKPQYGEAIRISDVIRKINRPVGPGRITK